MEKANLVNLEKHELKVEIKGITYHEMKIFKELHKDEFVIEYIIDL